jgi:hypothetical protein
MADRLGVLSGAETVRFGRAETFRHPPAIKRFALAVADHADRLVNVDVVEHRPKRHVPFVVGQHSLVVESLES